MDFGSSSIGVIEMFTSFARRGAGFETPPRRVNVRQSLWLISVLILSSSLLSFLDRRVF